MNISFKDAIVKRVNISKDEQTAYLRLLDMDAAEIFEIGIPAAGAPKENARGAIQLSGVGIFPRREGGYFARAEGITVPKSN